MRIDQFSALDLSGFNAGRDARAYEKLGAHPVAGGVAFAVWAPNAERVSVIGDWNGWERDGQPLRLVEGTGVWPGVVAEARPEHVYKYRVDPRVGCFISEKADP